MPSHSIKDSTLSTHSFLVHNFKYCPQLLLACVSTPHSSFKVGVVWGQGAWALSFSPQTNKLWIRLKPSTPFFLLLINVNFSKSKSLSHSPLFLLLCFIISIYFVPLFVRSSFDKQYHFNKRSKIKNKNKNCGIILFATNLL